MRRTAVGIDLGTTDVFAANVGRKGVDIVQNSVSERRTPALVSFTSRRRLLGDAAFAQVRSNYKNSCRGLKHLVGRPWQDSEIDAERFWALAVLGRSEHGDVGYEVNYRGQQMCVSATVCLSMLVTSIVATCKAWTKMDVREVVLAIPSYYTERVRQACLDALRIAGVQCLRLLHESTAIALAWRFESRGFEDASPIVVAFCSAGHSGFFTAIARFERGSVAILGEAYDRSVSGRAMDRFIMDKFVASLKKQGAPDPLESVKARLKLEEAATKVKKTLSVVEEARGVAECVVEDFDLACDVKRDDFEESCAPLASNAKAVIAQALAAAALEVKDLTHIEIVGGSSRVPWLQRAIREAFGGRELSTTLNADEAVARGCAWQAAMLSPSVRLAPIPLKESGSPAVAIEWPDSEAVEAEGSEPTGSGRRRLVVFEAQAGPQVEAEVSLRCRGPLEVSAVHLGEEEVLLGSWKLEFPSKEMQDVELQCSVDINGIFSIGKAAVCTGKEAAEAEAKAAAEAKAKEEEEDAKAKQQQEEAEAKAKAEADPEAEAKAKAEAEAEAKEKPSEAEANEEDGAKEKTKEEKEKPSEAEANEEDGAKDKTKEAESSPEGPAGGEDAQETSSAGKEEGEEEKGKENEAEEPMEFDRPEDGDGGSGDKKSGSFNWRFWQWGRGGKDAGKEGGPGESGPQKRKVGGGSSKAAGTVVRREPVALARVGQAPGYGDKVLTQASKSEQQFRTTDEAVVEAENRRNDFETYVFQLRDRVGSGDALLSEFASPEERSALSKELEEAESWAYENPEEEASVYEDRLKTLKKTEKECGNRKATLATIEEKVKALKASIKKYKATANSKIYEYIAKEKLDSITAECDSNTQWLGELEKRQSSLSKWEAPVLSIAELTVRNSTLTTNSTKILSEPRPKPPEAAKEEGKGGDKKTGKKGDKAEDDAPDSAGQETSAAADAKSNGKASNEEAAAAAAASRRRKMRIYGGVLGLLVLLPLGAVLAGLGKPYGIPSPLAPWLSGDGEGDFDDAVMDLGEAADPVEEAEEPGVDPASPLANGEEEL